MLYEPAYCYDLAGADAASIASSEVQQRQPLFLRRLVQPGNALARRSVQRRP